MAKLCASVHRRCTMGKLMGISLDKAVAFIVFVLGFLGAGIPFLVIGQNQLSYYDDLQANLPFKTASCTLLQSQWIEPYNDEGGNGKTHDDRCFDRYEYVVVMPGSPGTVNVSALEGPRTEGGKVCNGASAETACERCKVRAAPLPNGIATCWLATSAMTSDAADAFECSSITSCTKVNPPQEALDRLYGPAHNFRTGGIVGVSIGSVCFVALIIWHGLCPGE